MASVAAPEEATEGQRCPSVRWPGRVQRHPPAAASRRCHAPPSRPPGRPPRSAAGRPSPRPWPRDSARLRARAVHPWGSGRSWASPALTENDDADGERPGRRVA